jgi:hypothetical protein
VNSFSSYLDSTQLIDSDAKIIRLTTADLTQGAKSNRDKAIRIYRFVRDEIQFGFASAFYEMKASQVLKAKVGFCNTKSTLFIAMLRAAGIPARQKFVDLSARVLQGFVDTGDAYVDHSYTEVYLEGGWRKVDSYIIDQQLYTKAMAQLRQRGLLLGYGLHIDGISEWNGQSDSYVQFVNNGRIPHLSTGDYGEFHDVGHFYKMIDGWNKKTIITDFIFRMFVQTVNIHIQELRHS